MLLSHLKKGKNMHKRLKKNGVALVLNETPLASAVNNIPALKMISNYSNLKLYLRNMKNLSLLKDFSKTMDCKGVEKSSKTKQAGVQVCNSANLNNLCRDGKFISSTGSQTARLDNLSKTKVKAVQNELKSSKQDYLHNLYQIIGSQLECLLKSPYYSYNNTVWSYTYTIHEPKVMHFTEEVFNKKSTLQEPTEHVNWVRQNNFMGNFVKPIQRKLLQSQSLVLNNKVNYYTTSSEADVKEKPETKEEITKIRALYPSPKNTLHNFFDILRNELKEPNFKLAPQYKSIKHKSHVSWTCTYNLKWPEVIKFSETAHTKQEASNKTAISALIWLQKNNKITKDGKLQIYDREKVKEIVEQSYPILKIDTLTSETISQIENLYENNLKELVNSIDISDETEQEEAGITKDFPEFNQSRRIQQYMGLEYYKAHEPTKLPISNYKNEIIQTLNNNRVVIIKGEPGCGKSTRVPQYVLEAWSQENSSDSQQPCQIVVTQPRRIAAISLAERVATEREENVGDTVGFHVRLNSNFNRQTGRIMYCTTGILLQRLQQDPRILDCSHIILDEAHERDVNTDLLMNLIHHALELNPNLKVLVMSATLEAKLFQDYFNNAPILNIPGFTYPVEQHFLDESANLPKIHQMCAGEIPSVVPEEVVQIIKHIHETKPEGAILCFLPGWDEIMKVYHLIPKNRKLYVMCLHSKLEIEEQRKIFNRLPPGIRKIILATNIAETSVTIDDVVYVVDTGIHKEQRFDAEKGVNCIDNYWISQASATQRKGRAGRCQPGESYHLYPKSKYDNFQPHSIPEILRTSLTKIVLDSKVYSNNMNSIEFLEQLVSPPEKSAVERAVKELKELELLDENENLTPLGRTLSGFQLEPKLSKAMVNSVIFKCVTPIVDIATLFSADSPIFGKMLGGQAEIKDIKTQFSKNSDHLSLMRIYEAWLNYVEQGDYDLSDRFCDDKGLIAPKLKTIRKLCEIHWGYLHKGLRNALPLADDFADNDEFVKAVLLSGVGNVLQYRSWDIAKGRMKKTNVLITKRNQKATITSESINSRKGTFPSDFLLYINETVSNLRHTTIVRETSVISPLAVLLFKNSQLEIKEIDEADYSQSIPSTDQVLLEMQGTKIRFICDRLDAERLKKCKEILRDCVHYYTYQLTKGGEYNEEVNLYWKEILVKLNHILISQNLNDDIRHM